jgi:sugar phosphate isomerase/epimerase
MATGNGLRLGTTIYSFTNEFHARKYTVEQLIDRVGELGLGPGLEIVGFAHIREFPKVSDEFADKFKAAVVRNKLVPSCLGINADVFRRRNQPMTEDESFAYHKPQIEAAAKLGFPVARCQFVAGPEVIRRLAPLAERLNVKLGMELHAPETVNSPTVMAFREMMEKENSPYLGFIPDFSSSAKAVPRCFTDSFRQMGIPENLIQVAVEAWERRGNFPDRIAEYQKRMKAAGAPDSAIRGMMFMFAMLGRMDPKDWAEIVPQAVHIHGKCFEFDKEGNETGLPYEEILPVLVDAGYKGFMSAEWEGHAFSNDDGFSKVQAQHALCKRVLAGKASLQATVQ